MSKRVLKITKEGYTNIRGTLIPFIESYEDIRKLSMCMNINTKDKLEYCLEASIYDYLFGVRIIMNGSIDNDVIILCYNDLKNSFLNKLKVGDLVTSYLRENSTLPDKYIVNKDACILFYGNNKTIVKRSTVDKVDYVKAFLWAYFLHNSGMSRTKANKYLFKVWKSGAEVKHKK